MSTLQIRQPFNQAHVYVTFGIFYNIFCSRLMGMEGPFSLLGLFSLFTILARCQESNPHYVLYCSRLYLQKKDWNVPTSKTLKIIIAIYLQLLAGPGDLAVILWTGAGHRWASLTRTETRYEMALHFHLKGRIYSWIKYRNPPPDGSPPTP